MKIKAIVRFDQYERIFHIACGNGNKTFKWLANAVGQRYSLAAPNGSLRHRDDFCGISEHALYQTENITVPSGENPHPSELLQDYLQDGDTVYVDLCARLSVAKKTGAPQNSSWTTMAYSVSQEHLNADLAAEEDEDDFDEGHEELEMNQTSESGVLTASEIVSRKAARVNYMKIVLKSQIIDETNVLRHVKLHWSSIHRHLKLIREEDAKAIETCLADNWDILLDIFSIYENLEGSVPSSVKGEMTRENFISLIEDLLLFPAVLSAQQAILIFQHSSKIMASDSRGLKFDGFLVAIILAAQLKFNDTLDPKNPIKNASDSIKRLLVNYFAPLGRRLECAASLRAAFLSSECLDILRGYYETLQSLFDKISLKSKDFPTTITVEDFADTLDRSALSKADPTLPAEIDKARRILFEVRKGHIYGRNADVDPSGPNTFVYLDGEFTFSEFLEGIARAGYTFFSKENEAKRGADEPDETKDQKAIVDLMIKGFSNACDYATGKLKKETKAPSKAKGRK